MKKFLAILCLGILSVVALAAPKNIAGTWQAAVNGTPNASIKLIFTPKGEFKFVGSGYSSSGTYRVEGDTIQLHWTKVDDQPVKPGSMERTVALTSEDTFAIDRFTYSRKA
jgi:hypothetical protein